MFPTPEKKNTLHHWCIQNRVEHFRLVDFADRSLTAPQGVGWLSSRINQGSRGPKQGRVCYALVSSKTSATPETLGGYQD